MSKKPQPPKKPESGDKFSWQDGDVVPLNRDERLAPQGQEPSPKSE